MQQTYPLVGPQWRTAPGIVFTISHADRNEGQLVLLPNLQQETLHHLLALVVVEQTGAGLFDDIHLFAHPVIVGGGTRALPDGILMRLELVSTERIGDVVHTHHRVLR